MRPFRPFGRVYSKKIIVRLNAKQNGFFFDSTKVLFILYTDRIVISIQSAKPQCEYKLTLTNNKKWPQQSLF